MEIKNTNTEQTILAAAEKVFMDKGYSGTKTTEIAKEAGVNHAMLHYYFRTKENLFNRVFEKKAELFLSAFKDAFSSDLPFFEKIKKCVETHFDKIGENPKTPMFVLREVVVNKEKRDFILGKVIPAASFVLEELDKLIREEIAKGTITPIKPIDLLINIASLNVLTFIAAQVYFDFDKGMNDENRNFLLHRKKNNVDVILKSLQP
ncbi:MAG: TetR/AcrR family transcriptional regulator [Dysgonamonadaceae bacterium]|jgi:AcrR family transcriptional regulator|nr:TetR/AcrR family transcriptional regulator [Dysgonamonadaceae bacterium]